MAPEENSKMPQAIKRQYDLLFLKDCPPPQKKNHKLGGGCFKSTCHACQKPVSGCKEEVEISLLIKPAKATIFVDGLARKFQT